MKDEVKISDGNDSMRTLMELCNEAYKNIKGGLIYQDVKDFITNDKMATEFIRTILQDDEFETPDENSELYDIAQTRARHSAITFLIGLVLFKFCGLQAKILNSSYLQRNNENESVARLWMLTALYHDYGYFLKDFNNSDVDYDSGVKYYLLKDSNPNEYLKCLQQFSQYYKDVLAYTYGEIMAYGQYFRNWHKEEKHTEKLDHGILGGIRTFDKLIKRAIKGEHSTNELIMIKTSSLTIAQHNIFKSGSKEDDEKHEKYGLAIEKLRSTSKFVVNSQTPLLLLLGLVDTFECVKKFSQGENKSEFLKTKTVLEKIQVSVSQDKLIIDFTELKEYINRNKTDKLMTTYKNYRKNLSKLGDWTSFLVKDASETVIEITMKT